MTSKRALAKKADVNKKIEEIEEHHALGCKSFALPPKLEIPEMASILCCTAAKLREARQFAAPEAGYSVV